MSDFYRNTFLLLMKRYILKLSRSLDSYIIRIL